MVNLLPAQTLSGVNRVHHCDALTLLRALPSGSVDLIVTDPPYGVNKASWDARFPTEWIADAWRVTRRMLVMPGNTFMIEAANALGGYRDCISMYAKNGMTRSAVSFGNWFPVLVCGDWAWEARQNHYSFTISLTEDIPHPSPKPYAAMQWLIEKYTKPGWVILDPFAGSGTTLVAAQKLGRHYIGCDISAEYVEIARKRLAMPYTPLMFEEVG